MIRVAYMWSDMPGMPELALGLRESIGWEPVLWLGWPHLHDSVAHLFPGTPWQAIDDAWFGYPLESVSTEQPPALDEGTWTRLQAHLPRLMNQMNRHGPPDHFLYEEREVFARHLLCRWHEVLSKLHVDIAFWEESPSVPWSYAAYVVCEELNIKTLTLYTTKVFGLALLREQLDGEPLRLAHAYSKVAEEPDIDLPTAVQTAVEAVVGDQQFAHEFEANLAERESQFVRRMHVRARVVMCLKDLDLRGALAAMVLGHHHLNRLHLWLAKSRRRQRVFSYHKMSGVPFGAVHPTREDMLNYEVKRSAIKRRLRADYERRCAAPDYANDQYVYYALHYVPERTSNPDGGVFYDQLLPLTMISEALPEGWKLYVKEHGVQFNEIMEGECGRTAAYYDLIGRLKGVQFISTAVSSKELVLGAQAVASITGTVCWEAALLGRPAVYFGFPWYQSCPGTVRVRSAAEIAAVLAHPGDNTATQEQLSAWHQALAEAGFPFEFNAWQAYPGVLTDAEQSSGLQTALEWWHDNRLHGRTVEQC